MVEFGRKVDILSPLGKATEEADAHASAAPMKDIQEVDGRERDRIDDAG